jgi:thiosulfate/3-mercaptopyruvate sulfurtransferase
MKKVLFLVYVIASLSFRLSAEEKPILVSAQWLKEHQKDPDLVIVQVNFLKLDYDKEHIEGSRYLWPRSLGPDTPQGYLNFPDPKDAAQVLQDIGVSQNSHVVLVHLRSEVSSVARIFLTLENLGLKGNVSFLNGGIEAWRKEGYPLTSEIPVVKKGTFKPNVRGLIVDKDYVAKTLKSGNGVVVDARIQRVYDGEPVGYPREGHIAGAKNIPYTEMIDANNMFKPLDSLQTYFAPVATKQKELVAYCFIGQTASVVYMAGRLLGYNMKLYDGSMEEWSRLDHLPMEKTPK